MTSFSTKLRPDLLDEDLKEEQAKIVVEHVYDLYLGRGERIPAKLKTPGPAKELDEVFTLIRKAIDNYEARGDVTEDAKIKELTHEEPTDKAQFPMISILPTLRLPGRFSGGQVSKSRSITREVVYHIREETSDPDNVNYRRVYLGKFYDNWVDFTCWARSCKEAWNRAIWFENLLEEYAWFFTLNGVRRIMNQGHKERRSRKIGSNIVYGFPVECFIGTEKITVVSEKELERIVLQIGIASS